MRIGREKRSQRSNRPSGYKMGQWKMISDRSGQTFLSGDIKKEWTGLLVAKHEWEPRHPQEFVRGVVDDYAVRIARPRADLLSTISYDIVTGFVVERDSEIVEDRSGDIVVASRTSFGSEATQSGDFIIMHAAALAAEAQVSFATINITLDDLSHRQWLKIQYAEDDLAWYDIDDGVTRAILDNLQNGSDVVVSIGKRLRYIQIVLDPPSDITSTFTVTTFTLR